MKLRAGDWVEVRSKEEILRSLDKNGQLEELPFMPQMFQYCGQRFRVYKRAHKTCDTVSGNCGGRRLSNGVHLDLRCDGKAYGGCQAACLIFWKEAWLKPVDEKTNSAASHRAIESQRNDALVNEPSCTEEDVWKGTRAQDQQTGDETRYVCQATQLLYFTTPSSMVGHQAVRGRLHFRQCVIGRAYFVALSMSATTTVPCLQGQIGSPGPLALRSFSSPLGRRSISAEEAEPYRPVNPLQRVTLNLQPGELVRVKSYKEILATMDTKAKNRGLAFDAELVPYCGGIYRVRARVNNFIDEKTGKMKTLKTPAVMLEGVCCQSRYSNNRMFCPRSIYSWWREIWLERVPGTSTVETLRD